MNAAEVPRHRRHALARVLQAIEGAQRIVLTTHVNADGDGAGSEAALAAWLKSRGKEVTVVNPTAFPDAYRHLFPERSQIADLGGEDAARALDAADLVIVLDTSEPKRLGRLARQLEGKTVAVLDHHPPATGAVGGVGPLDPTAAATGELVYDLLQLASAPGEAWPEPVAEALYTALVTDTGSFRFANTQPRTHRITADLLERGVDPEAVYRRLFGAVPLRRIHLLRAALGELETDPDLPVSWITIPAALTADLHITSEDLDGIIEYARSIEGTEVALLFRETADGATRISFRSNGELDVNALAREFGGGGHVKAAGALVGEPLAAARTKVLEAVRKALRNLEMRYEVR